MQYLGLAYPVGLIVCFAYVARREVLRRKNIKSALNWPATPAPRR